MEEIRFFKTFTLPLVLVAGFFAAASDSVWADSADDVFKQANAAYAGGKFSDAVPLYQSAVDKGLTHWAVYYNLADAYYKSGQLGKAIVNYERAFRLNASERDVVYNLALATTKANDPVIPSDALPALGWRLFYSVSLNTLTFITSLLFLTLCGMAGLALWRQRGLPDAAIGVGFLMVIAGLWLGLRTYEVQRSEGIVVSSVAEVRSGPNTTYPANFTVPEGHHVLLLDEEEPVSGWIEIGVPQEGLKGWVPDSSLEKI